VTRCLPSQLTWHRSQQLAYYHNLLQLPQPPTCCNRGFPLFIVEICRDCYDGLRDGGTSVVVSILQQLIQHHCRHFFGVETARLNMWAVQHHIPLRILFNLHSQRVEAQQQEGRSPSLLPSWTLLQSQHDWV
jgi:hypothetical protein